MQLKDVKERVQERLVVIGAASSGLSLKWLIIIVVAFFIGGVGLGIKLDFSRFAEFRKQAHEMAARKEAENRKLERDLDLLRAQLDQRDTERAESDDAFTHVINAPSPSQCIVPVEPINAIIAEANK